MTRDDPQTSARKPLRAGQLAPLKLCHVQDAVGDGELQGTAVPIHDVRVSEIRPGQWWLFDGTWVRVLDVEVQHPDDRVTVTFELDGESYTTRAYRGFQRAAVRAQKGDD